MLFGNSFRVAMRGLLINKTRSFLALLGIIIGIGAVITITALAEGLTVTVEKQVDEMGTNLVFVVPSMSRNESRSQQARRGYAQMTFFNDREIRAIEAGLSVSAMISRNVQSEATVSRGRDSQYIPVAGIDEFYEKIYNYSLHTGRMPSPNEITGGKRVTVLGYQTAKDLFGNDEPLGQNVSINGNRFEVVGVLGEVGGGVGTNPNKIALVPLRVAQITLFGMGDKVLYLVIKAEKMQDVEVVKDDAHRAMTRVRRIDDPDDENFQVMTQTDALESFGQFV
ncbi:MAG TPA: hypothetical protein ENN67_01445, partial [Firmicutes bacterium]|nr:hypothetical protein [Bacillota bacterium]